MDNPASDRIFRFICCIIADATLRHNGACGADSIYVHFFDSFAVRSVVRRTKVLSLLIVCYTARATITESLLSHSRILPLQHRVVTIISSVGRRATGTVWASSSIASPTQILFYHARILSGY